MLHGLLRVRAFTQDDAHLFCTDDQIAEEVIDMLSRPSTSSTRASTSTTSASSSRPGRRSAIGTAEQWDKAEAALTEALDRQGREYQLHPGDGAFYGPKIDFHVTDALRRSWQCGTCQLDFFMPERFGLTYVGRRQRAITPR